MFYNAGNVGQKDNFLATGSSNGYGTGTFPTNSLALYSNTLNSNA